MATATFTRPALRSTGGTTELDAVLTGVPWGEGFDFNKGVDAITGSLMPSAIEPASPVERTVKKSAESYRFVQSESELDSEIETAVSGKYNIEGVTVSGSAEYVQKIKFSELAITLVASYRSEYDGYDEISQPQLTAQAKGLIGDHGKFRHQYGDYFVKGGKRGSTFYAVYVCQSRSESSMSEFKAKLGAETPDVFSAEGSARFMQAAKEHSISVSADLWMDGYEGASPSGPWTPEKIIEALAWFKQHEKGVHIRGELMHYSALDPSYPRSVDVAPEVFVALKKLYTALWTVRALYGSCPPNYQGNFTERYNDLINETTARQAELATDSALRAACQQKTDTLRAGLTEVFDRMVFASKVRDAIGTEPGPGHSTDDSGRRSYFYGYNQYPRSSAVAIKMDSENYADVWQIGYRDHVFDWRHEDRLVVGWEVVSNWADGTNGWWRQDSSPSVLMTHRANVYVKSWYDRGCNWTLNVWWVDAKDYDFT
jgi:hypothetical protein